MKKLLFILFSILPFMGLRANDWTFQPLTDGGGDFYLYNPYTGMFLGRGNDFATRASVNYQGLCWKITKDGEYWSLENDLTNDQRPNHFLFIDSSNNVWTDGDKGVAYKWSIEPVDGLENTYYLISESGRYLRRKDDATYLSTNSWNTVSNESDPAPFYWKLVTKNERESRKTATINKPQDMTWKIFNQNMDHWPGEFNTLGRWNETHTGNIDYRGGLGLNPCMEIWNGTFDVKQTHSNFPKGTYTLKAQGFYRVGNGHNDPSMAAEARRNGNEVINAYFYAEADDKVTKKNFCSVFDNNCTENKGDAYVSSTGYDINGTTYYVPTKMNRASKWFSDGAYEVELTFNLPKMGSITIGAKNETEDDQQWSIFDNFRLYYQPYFGELEAAINEAHDYESISGKTLDGLDDLLSTIEANHDDLTQDQVDSYVNEVKSLSHQQLGTDTETAWWTVFSEYYTLKPTDAKHVSFTHHCADAGWPYRTFGVLVVTNTERGTNGYTEYIVTRLDNNIGTKDVGDANWGTLNRNSINGTSAPNDGNTFLSFMNGADVDMYIYRNGADIYVKTIMSKGEKEYCKYYKTTGLPETEDVKFFLTGEGAYVDNFIVLNTTKPSIPYNLGKENNSTDYRSDINEPHIIKDGEAYSYTFKNHAGAANWNNYILYLKDANNKEIILRADKWDDKAWNNNNFTYWGCDDSWNFHETMDNATVTLNIYNCGGKIGVKANVQGGNGNNYTYTYINDVEGDVTAILSISNSWLELTNEGPIDMPSANLAISSVGWGTFIAPFDCEKPEGVTLYTVDGVQPMTGILNMTEADNIVANTPYLVKSEQTINTTLYGVATNTENTYTTGVLTGNLGEATEVDANAGNYLLQYNNGVLGFYLVANDGLKIGKNRCYLHLDNNAGGEVKGFFPIGDTTDAIIRLNDSLEAEQGMYDLSGRRLSVKPTKGLYIKGGKKVLVK